MTERQWGPIARQLLNHLAKPHVRKVVADAAFSATRLPAATAAARILPADSLARLHPLHVRYVAVQHLVSAMSESLLTLPEMARFTKIVADAEDTYLPSGPPMSPLTSSYFFYWAMFDAAVGPDQETVGTCLLAVLKRLGSDPEFMRLVEIMQNSRMGLYLRLRLENEWVWLRDLATGIDSPCLVPAGHQGKPNEVWLARVLPAPSAEFSNSIVIATPYVIRRPSAPAWHEFLERTLPKVKSSSRYEAYEKLMKYGLDLHYWNEYIFEAYAGVTTSAVFLEGLPDIDWSRPLSRQNEALSSPAPRRKKWKLPWF